MGEAVPVEVAASFEDARRQRADGVPVAYLLGRREFWSLDFAVNPAVLVPRPETELLVQRALDLVHAPVADVADLGTGSGAIAIALAHERPGWRVLGTDASDPALGGGPRQRRTPRRRTRRVGVGRLVRGARHAAVSTRLVSNPPYVAADDPVLGDDGLRHEPRAALTPGAAMDSRPWPLLLMGPPGTCSPAAGWRSNTAPRRAKRCVRCLWPVASLT